MAISNFSKERVRLDEGQREVKKASRKKSSKRAFRLPWRFHGVILGCHHFRISLPGRLEVRHFILLDWGGQRHLQNTPVRPGSQGEKMEVDVLGKVNEG